MKMHIMVPCMKYLKEINFLSTDSSEIHFVSIPNLGSEIG